MRVAVEVRGDIADSADVRVGRLQEVIHDHAVFDLEAAACGKLYVRDHTDADHDEIGGKGSAVGGLDAADAAALAQEPHHATAE